MTDASSTAAKPPLESGIPVLAPTVEKWILASIRFSEAFYELLPNKCGPTERENYTFRYLSLALDHREAIILLLRHGARSAAYALVRSVYEACMRGLWVQYSATQQQVDALAKTGIAPSFDTLIRQAKRGPEGGLAQSLARAKVLGWDVFSDYAHGGNRQISRWFSEDGIGQSHPDEEIGAMLLLLDIYAIVAVSVMCPRHYALERLYQEHLHERVEASPLDQHDDRAG